MEKGLPTTKVMQECLQRDELDLVKTFQLPKSDDGVSRDPMSEIISGEVDLDTNSLRRPSADAYDTLNVEKRHMYYTVVNMVISKNTENKIFALSASGGNGKTPHEHDCRFSTLGEKIIFDTAL